MSLSNYTENKIAELLAGKTGMALPAVYLALSTADPGEDGSTIAEPAGNGYARTATAGKWAAASGGTIANAANITFPEATASWGTVSHVALFDAVSGGNMLASGALNSSQEIRTGDAPRFEAGDLQLTVS